MPSKRQCYTVELKQEAVKYAERNGNRAAGRWFNVNESLIRRWRLDKLQLERLPPDMKARRGSKPQWPQLEEDVKQFVLDKAGRGLSAAAIRTRAKEMAEDRGIENFVASPNWCHRFMQRHKLSLRKKKSTAGQRPPRAKYLDFEELVASITDCSSQLSSIDDLRLGSIQRSSIHRAAVMGASEAEFTAAKARVGSLTEDPGNEVKLKMYGLFKQVTVGKCNAPKPGAFDFVGKAKWAAWNNLGELSAEDARQQYVNLVDELVAKDPAAQAAAAPAQEAAAGSASDYKNLLVTMDKGVCTITMNRPNKKNAIDRETYEELIKALETSGKDDSIVLSVLTGAGDFYSAGNDLNNFMSITPDTMVQAAKDGAVLLERFVSAFIEFPKPLIAAVNGPAVGIPVTSLGLCDVVYASDRATFHTPFSSLGQSPEACSSYLFPKIMGEAKANEVLLFGRKLTAQEACERGLVTAVFPDATFRQDLQAKVDEYSKLPKQSLRISKNLVRGMEKEQLHRVNKQECEILSERWTSEECIQAIMNFFASKSSKL